jgi:alpha-N-arabinofuranosidase
MANIAQSVNVISPLMTTKDGLVKQTTWWPLLLFSKFVHGWTIATHTSCTCYDGETEPKWMRSVVDTPWLDVSASVNDEGWVSLAVVNVHPSEDFEVAIDGLTASGDVHVYTVIGEKWDAVNTAEKEMVGLQESRWDGHEKFFKFGNLSMTMLRWKA